MAAVTDPYATVSQYRARIHHTDTSSDTEIADDLIVCSRYLERRLNRFYTQDAAPIARYYYPSTNSAIGNPESENPYAVQPRLNRYLYVDNMSAVPTEIRLDVNRDGVWTGDTVLTIGEQYGGTAGIAGDFELLPRNALYGPEINPWKVIYLPTWSTQLGFYPGSRVRVTCQWGWPAVPAAIVSATINLTAILRLETPRATHTITDVGTIEKMSPDAEAIIIELMDAYGELTF